MKIQNFITSIFALVMAVNLMTLQTQAKEQELKHSAKYPMYFGSTNQANKAAEITAPGVYIIINYSEAIFEWRGGEEVEKYEFHLKKLNGDVIYQDTNIPNDVESVRVQNIPLGEQIEGTIVTHFDGPGYGIHKVVWDTVNPEEHEPGILTSPTESEIVYSSDLNVTWDEGVNVLIYVLMLTSLDNNQDLFFQEFSPETTSAVIPNIPLNGSELELVLLTAYEGGGQDYSRHKIYSAGAKLISHENQEVLTSPNVKLEWQGYGIDQEEGYTLIVGSFENSDGGEGYINNEGLNTSREMVLPFDGKPYYVTLHYTLQGEEKETETLILHTPPQTITLDLTSPTENQEINQQNITLEWSVDLNNVEKTSILVGTDEDDRNILNKIYDTPETTMQDITIPSDAEKLNIRLFYRLNVNGQIWWRDLKKTFAVNL